MNASTVGRALAMCMAALLPLATAGCGSEKQYAKSIDGHVVDADSGKPIPGAYVYYLYEGPPETSLSGHGSSDVCYHASAAVSDSDGRFHIDPWEQKRRYGVENWEPTGWAYAAGYVPAQILPKESPRKEPEVRANDEFRLKESRAIGDERIQELWPYVQWGCLHGGESHKNLYPAFRAVYDEAKVVASTPRQKERLDGFRYRAAAAYLAPNPVADGGYWTEQIRGFMEKLQ